MNDFVDCNVCRIEHKNYFSYLGRLNGKNCLFKIDTGSDISIINKELITDDIERIPVKNINLRYPTGEKISIEFMVRVNIEIGNYSIETSMFVANTIKKLTF